ncbi:MAG: SUMF1/EgtB/PvdO family nonheme iron enzyme [Pseudomonadota bacterium]
MRRASQRGCLTLMVTLGLCGGLGGAACHDLSAIPAPGDAGPETLTCQPGSLRQGDLCVPEPLSCQSLAAICGPNKGENCCSHDRVESGRFDRGYDRSDTPDQDGIALTGWQSKDTAPAKMTAFFLDRYEVTVGRFRQFLERFNTWKIDNPTVGEGSPRNDAQESVIGDSGWRGGWRNDGALYAQSRADLETAIASRCSPTILNRLNDPARGDDAKPMTCVTWHEALLFCIWDGAGWLPTEAQWNYAAAHGEQQRAYPWSTPPDSIALAAGQDANIGRGGGDLFLDDVGSHTAGKGAWGQFDLAGNAAEWTYGFCTDCRCYADPLPDPTRTCPVLASVENPIDYDMDGTFLKFPNPVVRGGSYKYPAYRARTAYRVPARAGGRFDDTGWRCARPVPR